MKNHTYLFLFIAFIFPIVLYIQTISFGFTNFDDNRIITDNIEFLSDFGNVGKVFKTDAFITGTSHFYRPVQVLSYMADILASGNTGARMFHVTNILLFGIISALLYLFIRNFRVPSTETLMFTLVFTVHPLFVSVVAWIPARGDLLMALFSLLSFVTLFSYMQSRKLLYFVLHGISFVLALFSKETAVVLPALFILYIFITSTEHHKKNWVLPLLMYATGGLIWYLIRSHVINDFAGNKAFAAVSGQDELVGLTPFFLNIRTIPESLAKFFIPVDLDPIPSFTRFKTVAGSVCIVISGILLLYSKRVTKSEKIFCLLWFLLLMLPPMFFKHRLIDYLDHRFFLPLTGMILFILLIFRTDGSSKPEGKKLSGYRHWILVTLIVVLASYTFCQTCNYRDPMTFYNAAAEKNPRSSIAHNNLGALYHNLGNYDKAIKEYTRAIELYKHYVNAYNNRANSYLLQKSYNNAIKDYSIVLGFDPNDANSYNNRGVAYIKTGNVSRACSDFRSGYSLGSSSAGKNLARFCKDPPS